jgi:hypothetical protein
MKWRPLSIYLPSLPGAGCSSYHGVLGNTK